jgi:hypothetical protein
MALVAAKGANQNCAASIRNYTVISEYRSTGLAKKYVYLDAAERRNYC